MTLGTLRRRLVGGISTAGLAVAWPAGAQRTVTLSVVPGNEVQMSYTRTNVFGSDTDGPHAVAVTGTAVARITAALDPVHGLVPDTLRFLSSDIAFADTAFTTSIRFSLTDSFLGVHGQLGSGLLGPGTPIAAGVAVLDLSPIALEWTEGIDHVDFTGEDIPVAGMSFDLTGNGLAWTHVEGDVVELAVAIPMATIATRTYPPVNSDETEIVGTIALVGSYPVEAVPALGGPALSLLALALCLLGLCILGRAGAARGLC